MGDSDLTDSNGEGNGDFRDAVISELVLDYQKLFILEDGTTVTWFANETCGTDFQVLGYNLFSSGPVLSDDHIFNVSSVNTFTVPSDTSGGMDIGYRLVSLMVMCPDNRDFYYYRFSGILTRGVFFF